MTKTTSAWAWLAAGVFALGLNGFLHDEGANVARQIGDLVTAQTAPVLALASGNVQDFLAQARIARTRNQVQACTRQSEFVRIQQMVPVQLARVQALTAKQQAQLARLEVNRARIENQMFQFQFADMGVPTPKLPVICPRVRFNVPSPVVSIPAPTVRVVEDGNGPI